MPDLTKADSLNIADLTKPTKLINHAVGSLVSGVGGITQGMLSQSLKFIKNDILKGFVGTVIAAIGKGSIKNSYAQEFLSGISAGSAKDLAIALSQKFKIGNYKATTTLGDGSSGDMANTSEASYSPAYEEGGF